MGGPQSQGSWVFGSFCMDESIVGGGDGNGDGGGGGGSEVQSDDCGGQWNKFPFQSLVTGILKLFILLKNGGSFHVSVA